MNAADTAWMLLSAALVLLMTPALAFFYGGLVRSKNALNTMMMSVSSLGFVGVAWALLGYSLSFAPGSPAVGGLSWAFLAGVGLDPGPAAATIPHLLFMAYQGTFAIVTAALISGAIVERMRFGPYLAFITLWSLLVYAPVAHWVWGGGFLATLGALDFAGGTVVHVNAGAAALVAAMVLGPRKDYARQAMLPHNVPFTILGAGLLWCGWFGFNGGSALAANKAAALAFVNSFLAPCATLLVWTLLDLARNRKATAVGAATGIVVGLVAITPAAGLVSPASALALGAIAAFPSYFAIVWRARTRLDDSLDVVAAHGLGGLVARCSPAFSPRPPGVPPPTVSSSAILGSFSSSSSPASPPSRGAVASPSSCSRPSVRSFRFGQTRATKGSASTSASTERRPTPRVREPSSSCANPWPCRPASR